MADYHELDRSRFIPSFYQHCQLLLHLCSKSDCFLFALLRVPATCNVYLMDGPVSKVKLGAATPTVRLIRDSNSHSRVGDKGPAGKAEVLTLTPPHLRLIVGWSCSVTIATQLIASWGTYHGGRRPSSDDSLHSSNVIPPSAFDKPSIMKHYHRR